MNVSDDRRTLIDNCLDGNTTPLLVAALDAGDLVTLAVVSVIDAPCYDRLEALHRLPTGSDALTELIVAVLTADASPAPLLEVVHDYVQDYDKGLELTAPQTTELFHLLTNDTLEDEHAATIFSWLAPKDPTRTHQLAAESVATAQPPGSTTVKRQLALLGASANAEHHLAVIAFAQRCADANQSEPALEALILLVSPADDDLAPVALVFQRLLANGQAISDVARIYLALLSSAQIVATIQALSLDNATAPRFDQQLLPHIFATHTLGLVETVSADWWQPSSRNWILDEAPWADHDDDLLPAALKATRQQDDDDAAVRIRRRIVERVAQTTDSSTSVNSMPRIGARTLLIEALDGTLSPDDPLVRDALVHLSVDDRHDEYRRTTWKTPNRAQRLAAVVATVDMADVTDELMNEASSLKDPVFAAWLPPIAAKADDDLAETLAGLAAGRPAALQALANTRPGAGALTRRWESTDDLHAFRAVKNSEWDDDGLIDHIPDAIRNYDGPLSIPERCDLIGYVEDPDRIALLLAIIADRKRSDGPQSPPELIVVALDVLGDTLAGEDPGANLEELADLCRNHLTPSVRIAAYEAIGRCRPTAALVALLVERRTGEKTPSVTPAVDTALDGTAEALAEVVANAAGDEGVQALELLDAVDPGRALPHARRMIDEEVEDPAHRILAIQVIGNHGDESDLARLKTTAEHDPNPEAQEVLQHAIRQIEIGDVADAHRRLGELAGVDTDTWNQLDPDAVWAGKTDTLVAALVRINKYQVNADRESTIDQLGAELAKLVLYHTIATTGAELSISNADRVAITGNTMPYGDLVKRPQLTMEWDFVGSLHELYKLRREHLSPQGTWDPFKELTHEEYDSALFLFKRGAGPCLDRLAAPQASAQ